MTVSYELIFVNKLNSDTSTWEIIPISSSDLAYYYYLRQGGYKITRVYLSVCLSVCLSFCLSVCEQDYVKTN